MSADYAGFPARREKARTEGRRLGFGIATGLKGTGRGPFESAIVRVGRSGKVSIFTGAMAMGQGLKTVLAQIAADRSAFGRRTSRWSAATPPPSSLASAALPAGKR